MNEGGDDAPSDPPASGAGLDIEVEGSSWGGTLPVPVPPPLPSSPHAFAAGPRDPAGVAAREIARRIPTFRNWRAEIHGATWWLDGDHAFRIRSSRACLRALAASGVPYALATEPLKTPVPTPVEITGPIDGVRFESAHIGRPVLVSCELAMKMTELARIFREHEIAKVRVLSSYRDHPRPSFHTFGLALDMSAFIRRDGTHLVVQDDFELTPGDETCDARPESTSGRALLDLACAIVQSRIFSSVLTPNYNPGHRDHFHVDARPDDPRFFLR